MKDIEIEKRDIIAMHAETLRLVNGSMYASIFSAQDFFSINSEARTEGSKPFYSEKIIAQALVVKNLAQRLIGNFIIRINKPKSPTKMFSNKQDAKIWIVAKIKDYESAKKKKTDAMFV